MLATKANWMGAVKNSLRSVLDASVCCQIDPARGKVPLGHSAF